MILLFHLLANTVQREMVARTSSIRVPQLYVCNTSACRGIVGKSSVRLDSFRDEMWGEPISSWCRLMTLRVYESRPETVFSQSQILLNVKYICIPPLTVWLWHNQCVLGFTLLATFTAKFITWTGSKVEKYKSRLAGLRQHHFPYTFQREGSV